MLAVVSSGRSLRVRSCFTNCESPASPEGDNSSTSATHPFSAASHVVESETGSFLAALSLQSAGAREVVIGPVARTEDFFTGLGLLNPSPSAVLSTIELFDPAAQRLGVHFLTLGPGEKQSHVLFELMSIVRHQSGGFVRIRSTSPIYTVGSLGGQRLNFLTLLSPHVLVE